MHLFGYLNVLLHNDKYTDLFISINLKTKIFFGIFISMADNKVQRMQKRRILSAEGWLYFCNQCGDYKPEEEFYKSKSTPFGFTYKCKLHFKYDEPADPKLDYLKLNPITDDDLEETEKVLNNMGYKTGPDELPIWQQFNLKHNLQ